MAQRHPPADGVGIQVPAGRIAARGGHWQTVLVAPSKPSIYRLHNGSAQGVLIVEADGAKRPVHVAPGASVDVLARRIRVRAGGAGQTAEGWYVLVS